MDLKLNNLSEFALTNRYIPVEYVQTSGYPNINTGVTCSYATRNVKVDLVIDVVSNSDAGSIIFDATNGSRHTYLKCVNANDNTSFVTKYYQQNTQTETSIQFSGKTHIIESVNYLKVDNTEYTLTNTSDSVTATLYLFKSGSTVTKVHAFKVYQSNTLIRDYIPVISCQEGHLGEACLYDKVNGVFYYSAPTGSFTASTNICDRITTAFVKDCPNVSGIDLLRIAVNLQRVRCNVANVSGSIEELQHYATLSGYSDNYEEQTKPRIVGNFTINTYHTNEEKNSIDIDGLILFSDNNYNIDYLLDNQLIAIQTLDEDEPEYNQPVAEILLSNNLAHSLASDNTKIFMTKTEAAAITSLPVTLFRGNTNIVSFNEFKYWTGLTTITAGTNTSATTRGAFGGCTALTSIEIPEGVTTIGAYAFYGCTVLNRIVIPKTLTTTGNICFANTTAMNGGSVYYNGTLEQWMNISFAAGTGSNMFMETSPCGKGAHFYINNEEITSIEVPNDRTTIKAWSFAGMKYLTQITVPNTVTSIGSCAIYGCTSLVNVTFPKTSTMHVSNAANSGTGTLICGTTTSTQSMQNTRFAKIIIDGNVPLSSNMCAFFGGPVEIRVHGSILNNSNHANNSLCNGSNGKLKFVEVGGYGGSVDNGKLIGNNLLLHSSGGIIYLNSNTIVNTPTRLAASYARLTKIYVGDGSSRANDEAVLALYLADTNWSAYSTKLATWYDYNGEYKWYYVTDNLTNCTNTNPDEWPHITRGDTYSTGIVADEGMIIDSITVEMLDTDTTSPTYDTYVDITSTAVVGTSIDNTEKIINIPSVTGNVIITASAS